MNEIAAFCQSLKKDFTRREQNPRQPVHCWSEKEGFDGMVADAYVIILRTRGCSWMLSSGCTMCGYFNDSMFTRVSEEDLQAQFDNAIQHYKGEKIIKLFTSGSFLDSSELSESVQRYILNSIPSNVEKISVESRPQYITEERVIGIKETLSSKEFEIGIGLETSNDLIREHAINKGFSFQDYVRAVMLLQKHQIKVKTYVLMKPPFLTEKEALDDCILTTKETKRYADSISLNPTNVQHQTVVEYLWKRNQYRPPWLWSIVEYLKQSTSFTDAFVKCDVVGGGSRRGPHNCGICDKKVLDAITEFSLSQDKSTFQNLSCDCQEKWHDQLNLETLSFGSFVDFLRWNP